MNKQQLAAKIWESANKMRSKIEANEYKVYILGFMFYKFLSEKELKYLRAEGWTDEYLPEINEHDNEVATHVKRNIGYFISYENLFSTWINKGRDFSVQNVTDALNAFSRNINSSHKSVFEGIFETLQTGLSKLGETDASRSKSISELIHLIKNIPMDGKQDYDVLGFIYEYLIEKFAANAGKKASKFYTPHEVSVLMSEIVAEHLKDLSKLEKTFKASEGLFEIDDLEIFENVAYIMAYHADRSIAGNIDDWLDQFEMFSIYEILPEILELWGANLETEVQSKKLTKSSREMTTALFLLRCVEIGISISELDLLTIGMVLDIWTEKSNDGVKYSKVAGQAEFDKF